MSKSGLDRREFLGAWAAGFWLTQRPLYSEKVPIHYRQQPPYEQYRQFIVPGHDEFVQEKAAIELEAALKSWWQAQQPLSEARFYALPGGLVRCEIKDPGKYRTGTARVLLDDSGRISGLVPVEEYTASSESPLFRDVTASVF